MGSTLIKGNGGEENEHQTELNAILKSIGNEVNHILQNQNKNLETIRQSLNEQTNYLKTIADNIIKPSMNFSQTKLGDIKNINGQKSIQIINQSSNVPLQQQIQEKQSLDQKQKNISEQNKLNKMNKTVSQIPQLYMRKMTEIRNKIQIIQFNQLQFSKEQMNRQKNNSIQFIKKDKNQLQQKISTMEFVDNQEKNRVNIDYKDRFLLMPLVKYDKNINMINPWISDLYERLSEESFYGYLNKHMTKQQMKVFYSQNIILNTIKLIRSLTEKNPQISVKQILKKFGQLSGPALEFQLKKYPQKKKIFIRPQIQNMVQPCQIHEDPQYDILANMKFRYQYQENGIYYRQIKLMINKIIKLTNQHFQSYQTQMKKIFVIQWEKQQKSSNQKINKEQNISKQQNINEQQRIPKEYIQHQIGMKINQNTPQFEQYQINDNKLTIQSPQMMRIIIKWIEELEDKINIKKIQNNQDNRYYPFPYRNGGQLQFPKVVRQQISKKFKQYLNKPDQHNKLNKNLDMLQNIEGQMINYIDTNSKSFTYIQQNNTEVGLATHLLSETIQEIAIKRLNQVLHTILSFQQEFGKKTIDDIQYEKYNFSQMNYITFSIYDLLRSKCTGSYQKIKLVYTQLKQNNNFKIIRVQNRLATCNRDFLINMRFKNTPIICELRLELILEKSNLNQKQLLISDFNNFLYELKRSKYGPLTQAVMLNAHYSQTITFFQQKLKKIKFQKEMHMKILSIIPKICYDKIQIPGYEIQKQHLIFVCHNCFQVKSTKTSFLNTYKKKEKNISDFFQYFCGECVVNTLQVSNRNKYLLGDYIDQYFQQTNYDQILQSDKKQIEKNQLLKIKQSYYLIISSDNRRFIVKRLDKDYFIKSFSSLVSQQYIFLKINQLDIKYVYRLSEQINNYNNKIKIHNIQQLNQRVYINQQRGEFLIKNKANWKQAVCIKGKKGSWRLIDATKQQNAKDYDTNLNLFIKTKEMKKINLSENGLTDINQIIKQKNIIELNLNSNLLRNVIIPIQSLIKLQINNNLLVDTDLNSLVNLQILDISHNHIEKIELDKLVKLHQVNLSHNEISELTLNNKQCQKLNLSNNKLVKLDISKMEKLKELRLNLNRFQNLTLNNLKLQYLEIFSSQLSSVDFKALVNLKYLNLTENKLQYLYLDNPLLETLYVQNNILQTLELNKLNNLKVLDGSHNKLTQFPETFIKSLQILILFYNKLKKIKLNGFGNLRQVDISQNQIDQFIVGNLQLQKITAWSNKIKNVNITKLSKIRIIDFSHNKIRQIVLKNETLQKIQLSYNRIYNINIDELNNLRELNICNNCIRSINITKHNNPKLQRIELINSESDYIKYFIGKLLTEQQKARYEQQKISTKAEDIQILTYLRFYRSIRKETTQNIIQSIKRQYKGDIYILDDI